MQKIVSYLLIGLFFSIPLIHGQLLRNLGIDLSFAVEGNYEFTKSQFFLFISGIIFGVYSLFLLKHRKTIIFPKISFFILGILGISTLFSTSIYTSFFGLNTKGHGALLFVSLFGIYFILMQQDKDFIKKLFYSSLLGALFASILAIKEYYFPSFSYGDLSNRAIGTFGHPNYLVGFLLLVTPFIIAKAKLQKILYIMLVPIVISIFLTKSAWGILIFLSYIGYVIFSSKKCKKIHLFVFLLTGLFLLSILVFQFGGVTKLHSFLSRFYIWETVIRITIDTPKILLVGSGAETLINYFESYKSPELYIFENFGFVADRPHNLFLNILFHFGLGGIGIFLYSIFKFIKLYENNYLYHALIIVLLFSFFNFLSIASYLVVMLILSRMSDKKETNFSFAFPIFFFIFSTITLYASSSFYYSEILSYSKKYDEAITTFPYNYKNYEYISDIENTLKYSGYFTKNFFVTQLHSENIKFVCDEFIQTHKSAESSFYCGNYAWNHGDQALAKNYYNQGLEKLPNLWNSRSNYHSQILISQFVDGKRFFSPKYSNIIEILQRMRIENTFK